MDGGDELVAPVSLGLGGLPGGPPGNFKSGRAVEAHTALPLETKDRAAALARFQELSRELEKAKSEGKTHKVWRIVKDGNTREAHRVMEGVTVPIDEDFTVAGERLRLPSDVARGSPGNVFNCRCFVEFVTRDGEGADTATVRPPVVNLWSDRRKSIVEDTPAVFEIAESPGADGSEPLHALHSQSQVEEFDEIIIEEARRQQVDPDLVRAIMYVETTQGWYDAFFPFNRTQLPMNIHSGFWKDLGWTREQLKKPRINIRAGVTLLKRIGDRIENPTVEKIATIYNSLGRERVSDYGARVGVIFNGRLWEGEQN